MGNKTKSLAELESDGFSIYSGLEQPKKTQPKASAPPQPKIIIMDNRDVLKAVAESQKLFKESIENLMASMYSMSEKPDSFTLDVQRDQHGFMKSITVKVNK